MDSFRWDTGEVERMSPWDLQPVTEHGMYSVMYFVTEGRPTSATNHGQHQFSA